MKTPVATLILALLQLPLQAAGCPAPKIHKVDVAFSCAGTEELCLPVVTAAAQGAAQEDSQGEREPGSDLCRPHQVKLKLSIVFQTVSQSCSRHLETVLNAPTSC